jgi:hypothetical protein
MKIRLVKRFTITGPDGSLYLTRWTLRLGPLGAVRLHRFYRPDLDQDQHDHPWPFVSVVLRGWYVEELGGCREHRTRGAGSFAYRPAAIPHRVIAMPEAGCWTLLWTGRDRGRDWGFYTSGGWQPWRQYLGIVSQEVPHG